MRLWFVMVLLLLPSFSFAESLFESNGYNISIKISYIGRNQYIEGRVNSGKTCKTLTIRAKAIDEDGHEAYFKTEKFEYTEGYSILYESGTSNTSHINSGWGITSVSVSCEDSNLP